MVCVAPGYLNFFGFVVSNEHREQRVSIGESSSRPLASDDIAVDRYQLASVFSPV